MAYSVGTVSVALNSNIMHGTGTAWLTAGVAPGDFIRVGTLWFEIDTVPGETQLNLKSVWLGANASGLSYSIEPTPQASQSGGPGTFSRLDVGQGSSDGGKINVFGSHSGKVTLAVHSDAGNITLVLPSSDGENGQVLKTDGAGVLSWASVLRTGSGAPAANLGVSGEYYLDIASGTIYGPKAVAAWPVAYTPVGVDGTIITGAGAPTTDDGKDGQFYIDSSTGVWYGPKAAGTWPTALPIADKGSTTQANSPAPAGSICGNLADDAPVRTATVAIALGAPATFILASHGLVANQPVFLTTTDTLPDGVTENATYYVSATGLATGWFALSVKPGGDPIAASGAQAGTHTLVVPTTAPRQDYELPALVTALRPLMPVPTRTTLLSGSGTYTAPEGCTFLRVRMIGGGGGGGGCGTTTPGAGGAGGDTTLGTFTAKGGSGGGANNTALPTDGGAGGSGGAGTASLRISGAAGASGAGQWSAGGIGPPGNMAGSGGASPLGGAGAGSITNSSRVNAATNSGSGGGGGTSSAQSVGSGSGGGAGEYVELLIPSPAATYTYTVGAAGAAGTAGGGAGAALGGTGGAGLIVIEEF